MWSKSGIQEHYQMNRIFWTGILVALLMGQTVYGQLWSPNDAIFNPSGVPSLPFSQPRFADLDADGDVDMILGSVGENLLYMENSGSPTSPAFIPGEDVFENVPQLDAEMGVCVDLDDDGDLDLICGGFTGLNLYLNTGNATNPVFEKISGFFDGLAVGQNPIPDLADMDGDDDLDMVVGLSESGLVKIYTNTGSPMAAAFSEVSMVEIGDVGLYAYPNLNDLDGDGDQDLLVGRDGYGFVYYKNTGNPNMASWEEDPGVFEGLGMDTYWNSPGLADLNGDDQTDLVFGTYAGPLNYYINSGTPSVPAWTVNTTLFGGVIDVGAASNPYFFDYDGDGDLDLFTGTQLGDIKYYENTGTTTGPAWEENSDPFVSLKHSIYSAVAVGDVNNDGLPDAIVGDLNGHLYYHRSTGEGFVEETAYLQTVALGGWSAPRLADFDSDEDLDIIAGNEAGNLTYIRNEGSPENPEWVVVPGFFGGIDVGMNCVAALYDIDFDDDLDVLCGNLSGSLTYFENQDGEWTQNAEIFQGISGGQNTTPALADLDGDGDPDLTLGQYSGIFNYYVNHIVATDMKKSIQNPANFAASIYPNPFSTSVQVRVFTAQATSLHMQVLNASGVQVMETSWHTGTSGDQTFPCDLSKLSPVIYYVRLSAEFTKGLKVMVMKVVKI